METFVEPKQYLTTVNGGWSVVSGGNLLCPMRASRAQAEAVAKMFGIKLPNVFWNGDYCRWDDSDASKV